MKSISNSLRSSLALASLLLMLSTTVASAQDEFPDDVDDEPSVPIDGFVITGLVAGSVLGMRRVSKAENDKI